ncbi:MAG: hypothetical protein VB030_04495 [Eubacterium aggregans]|uniref:hypothetical protein n=1 Tax=Eubacterium aggregans TaxID=81409 RepID=UPI002B20E042|nr:hypothetical protein [Eubacterium aggregans]MEA5073416.1 hypothetical protein [Eubacterium aggregans]
MINFDKIYNYLCSFYPSTQRIKRSDFDKSDGFSFSSLGQMIFRIKYSKKNAVYYLEIPEVPTDFASMISEDIQVSSTSIKGFSRYEFSSLQELDIFSPSLQKIYNHMLNQYTDREQFGCCHRYVECSDAMKCLLSGSDEDTTIFSNSCMYKENLENGKIFYGKNRNTD